MGRESGKTAFLADGFFTISFVLYRFVHIYPNSREVTL